MPIQAVKSRPVRKPAGSGTEVRTAAAMMSPTPGIVVRRRAASSAFTAATILLSSFSILSVSDAAIYVPHCEKDRPTGSRAWKARFFGSAAFVVRFCWIMRRRLLSITTRLAGRGRVNPTRASSVATTRPKRRRISPGLSASICCRSQIQAGQPRSGHQRCGTAGHGHRHPGFTRHPLLIDGCSNLFFEVFGERGMHARTAVGAGSLPSNIPVKIEAIFEVATS